MIKEDKVLIPINIRNKKYYIDKGYDIDNSCKNINVYIEHLNIHSKVKVTAICEMCGDEHIITYNKYIMNKNRNNKGYYSCFKCKNIEKEKTCLKKYGVRSYSMTEQFKLSESIKWKGIRKGNDKYLKTMLEKYGVDCYFKTKESRNSNRIWMSSNEFKEKSKITLFKKYGVERFCKTEQFKKMISDNKDLINEKIRQTFMSKYGVEYYSRTTEWKINLSKHKQSIINKIKNTCLLRYQVNNISQLKEIQYKIRKTKERNNTIIPNELLSEWELYKKDIRKLTNRNKKSLYENWDGYDYYDNELIIGYLSHTHIHRFYPTIDHKISTYYGFINNIPPEDICDISNLCITKRYINCKKNRMIEEDFNLDI